MWQGVDGEGTTHLFAPSLAENALARCFRLNEKPALVPANNSELDMTKLIADPQIQQYLLGLVAQSMKNIHVGEPHSQSD